jgi:hypothetical protein
LASILKYSSHVAFWKERRAAEESFQAAKEDMMAKYIALHTLKKGADEVMKAFTEASPQLARAMAAGETPAKCIKTWNPVPHGRTDYVFCLWEADKPEDINASLGQFLDYVTIDIFKVDEIDWQEFAKSL